jgi:hypothetical protein
MPSSAQNLPPKMAAHYAKLAKEGKSDKTYGEGSLACYEFKQGTSRNTVVLISLDPPIGHIIRT